METMKVYLSACTTYWAAGHLNDRVHRLLSYLTITKSLGHQSYTVARLKRQYPKVSWTTSAPREIARRRSFTGLVLRSPSGQATSTRRVALMPVVVEVLKFRQFGFMPQVIRVHQDDSGAIIWLDIECENGVLIETAHRRFLYEDEQHGL